MSRNTHSRTDDHHGAESTTAIELAALIERYEAGSVLHNVLASLAARVAALEATLGIYTFEANSVIKRTQTPSFTADSVRLRTQTGSFTADAVIQ